MAFPLSSSIRTAEILSNLQFCITTTISVYQTCPQDRRCSVWALCLYLKSQNSTYMFWLFFRYCPAIPDELCLLSFSSPAALRRWAAISKIVAMNEILMASSAASFFYMYFITTLDIEIVVSFASQIHEDLAHDFRGGGCNLHSNGWLKASIKSHAWPILLLSILFLKWVFSD